MALMPLTFCDNLMPELSVLACQAKVKITTYSQRISYTHFWLGLIFYIDASRALSLRDMPSAALMMHRISYEHINDHDRSTIIYSLAAAFIWWHACWPHTTMSKYWPDTAQWKIIGHTHDFIFQNYFRAGRNNKHQHRAAMANIMSVADAHIRRCVIVSLVYLRR